MGELNEIAKIAGKSVISRELSFILHYTEEYPHDIVNLYSDKLSTDEVNVDQCIRRGKEMLSTDEVNENQCIRGKECYLLMK